MYSYDSINGAKHEIDGGVNIRATGVNGPSGEAHEDGMLKLVHFVQR
jgi:hypothetical protein